MSGDDNVKTIQAVYEAFGRGDIPTVLDAVADDVDWASEADSTDAPWWGPRTGRAGVAEFFEQFGAAMEVDGFTPLAIAADGDTVLSVVHLRARSRATGAAADMDLHHWFRFRAGKIASYRGTEDTLQTRRTLQ
ncbi:MAG TPA: nuclear transport factor 2 family protein [Acidimicrobiia bacterium]|nr:nuclear transport factor 2 family protein [Acidimicrobiia bacterium]